MLRLNDFSKEFTNDATDIRGRNVIDRDGQDIGQISAMFVDAFQRKIRFIGVNAEESPVRVWLIPVDAVTQVEKARITIALPRQQVLDSPEFDLDARVPSEEDWIRLYDHYGYVPHWLDANIFPGYPSE